MASAGSKLDKETLGELGILKILSELEELAEPRMALLAKGTDFTDSNLLDPAFLAAYWPKEYEVVELANEIGQLIVNKNAPEKEIDVDVGAFAGMDVDGLLDKVDPEAVRQVAEISERAATRRLLDGPRPRKTKLVARMIKWQKEYEKKLLAQAVDLLRQTNPGLVEEAAKIQSDLVRKIDSTDFFAGMDKPLGPEAEEAVRKQIELDIESEEDRWFLDDLDPDKVVEQLHYKKWLKGIDPDAVKKYRKKMRKGKKKR